MPVEVSASGDEDSNVDLLEVCERWRVSSSGEITVSRYSYNP